MSTHGLHLSGDELWATLLGCDPIALARRALTGAAGAGPREPGAERPVSPPADGITLCPRADGVTAVPAARLEPLWAATIAATIAHALIPPGVIIAGLVGGDAVADAYAALLVRVLPDLSHVAVSCGAGAAAAERLVRRLRPHGVSAAYAADPHEAVRGSDLVVLHAPVPPIEPDWIGPGAVLVEAGHGAAAPLRADHVFADRPLPGETGLDALLADRPASRHLPAGVVLVRVRGTENSAAELAAYLHRTALVGGHGTPVALSETGPTGRESL